MWGHYALLIPKFQKSLLKHIIVRILHAVCPRIARTFHWPRFSYMHQIWFACKHVWPKNIRKHKSRKSCRDSIVIVLGPKQVLWDLMLSTNTVWIPYFKGLRYRKTPQKNCPLLEMSKMRLNISTGYPKTSLCILLRKLYEFSTQLECCNRRATESWAAAVQW